MSMPASLSAPPGSPRGLTATSASPDFTIILDLSRLLSRLLHPTPTGVDRVEMAYARGLMAAVPKALCFAAVQPSGIYGRLPAEAVLRFLDRTEARWQSEGQVSRRALHRAAVRSLLELRPRLAPIGRDRGSVVYVQSSPHHLTRPTLVASLLRRERARFVCMVHDLIPLDYPEYARADGAQAQAQRIDTVVRQADGVIVNSHATLLSLQPYLDRAGRMPITRVAHLGTAAVLAPRPAKATAPYFVCLGTIEPRKNHLLLLNLWRRLSERFGAQAIPKLVVIGRRGWENEQIVDMLERCPALVGCVEEHAGLPDREVQRLLAGARALLLPSFAEGYGMPVTEAIALGVPVVCSDLAALREAGGDVPEFLDPLDGPGWLAAIADLASDNSEIANRQRQLRPAWHAPGWEEHIAILLNLLHRVTK
jgi:glycosyltransferase involved in cell wall biosynthesis